MVSYLLDSLLGSRDDPSALTATGDQLPPPDIDAHANVFDPRAAGVALARLSFRTFYNARRAQFCSPFDEPGTVDAIHGYTAWPVAIAVWAAANTAKRTAAPADVAALARAVDALDRHWSDDDQGYCAWLMYPGNRDIYFDDNAHAGNALLTAWEATRQAHYLARARAVVAGILRTGWDEGGDGGVAWRLGAPHSRNACSTLSAAVLGARLALLGGGGPAAELGGRMARACVAFAERRLVDPADGLVWDAWVRGDDGAWRVDARKFTYNTGFGVHAYVLLFELSGEAAWLAKAERMARAALDPGGALMDRTLGADLCVWGDVVFFAAHLVEALVLCAAAAPGGEVAGRIREFLARFAAWVRVWMGDPHDGLYYRQLRPYWIDRDRTDGFNRRFGKDVALHADEGERENGEGPVEGRRLIKTLLANAAVANIYLYISDTTRSVDLPGEWDLS